MTPETLSIIEILGLLFGVAYVIGAILEKKWCWYVGIIATILYAISVFHYQLYGEFIVQFFYLAVSVYGLFLWQKKTDQVLELQETDELKISHSSISFLTATFIMGSLFSVAFYFILVYFDGSFPFFDALTSGFGVSTTYMTAKKKIENWIFWIIIDIVLMIILYQKQMFFYSGLYGIYAVFAAFGWFQWKEEI